MTTTKRFNLRAAARGETRERERFAGAIDTPHDSKSYYPPMQFLQEARRLDEQRKRIFEHLMTRMPAKNGKLMFGHVMTQMTAKAGIRKHGMAAEAAMMKEFGQLEDLSVYVSVDASTLTRAQKRRALRALNLIKEKRDGTLLNGRCVADGSAQRPFYKKSDTASPTVATDALMLWIMIDALERRDVATADVVGAYLKAYMKDFVLMKFTEPQLAYCARWTRDTSSLLSSRKG